LKFLFAYLLDKNLGLIDTEIPMTIGIYETCKNDESEIQLNQT
jgi:hypothetical protein